MPRHPPRLWKHGITFAMGHPPKHRPKWGMVSRVPPKRSKAVKLPPRLSQFAGWQMKKMYLVDNEANPTWPHRCKHLYFTRNKRRA